MRFKCPSPPLSRDTLSDPEIHEVHDHEKYSVEVYVMQQNPQMMMAQQQMQMQQMQQMQRMSLASLASCTFKLILLPRRCKISNELILDLTRNSRHSRFCSAGGVFVDVDV